MADIIRKNLNVPNILSLLRLLMVPVYVFLFKQGNKYAALAVFIIASLTDFLDGYLARKYGLITDVGKLLDPLADKLMVVTAMLSMTLGNDKIPGVLPPAAVIIVILKEIAMVIAGSLFLKNGIVVYSLMIGKLAHATFIFGLIASYFHDWFLEKCQGWFLTPDLMLVWLGVILALAALVWYAIVFLGKLKAKKS